VTFRPSFRLAPDSLLRYVPVPVTAEAADPILGHHEPVGERIDAHVQVPSLLLENVDIVVVGRLRSVVRWIRDWG
jgi:hypothetical protein